VSGDHFDVEDVHTARKASWNNIVSNPATRQDLADRTWGVFWYKFKMQVLFEIIVQNKQKGGTGV